MTSARSTASGRCQGTTSFYRSTFSALPSLSNAFSERTVSPCFVAAAWAASSSFFSSAPANSDIFLSILGAVVVAWAAGYAMLQNPSWNPRPGSCRKSRVLPERVSRDNRAFSRLTDLLVTSQHSVHQVAGQASASEQRKGVRQQHCLVTLRCFTVLAELKDKSRASLGAVLSSNPVCAF